MGTLAAVETFVDDGGTRQGRGRTKKGGGGGGGGRFREINISVTLNCVWLLRPEEEARGASTTPTPATTPRAVKDEGAVWEGGIEWAKMTPIPSSSS